MSVEDERHARNCDCERCEQKRAAEQEVMAKRNSVDKMIIAAATKLLDPYAVTIGGVRADPARIARAYDITDGMLFSALKKILRSGRKHKDIHTDIAEAITSLQRWEEMNREDSPT